jgi:hypothetical protein
MLLGYTFLMWVFCLGQLTHCHWNCVKVFIFYLFWGTGQVSNGQQTAVVKDEPDRIKELSYFWSWNAWASSWCWATQTTRQVPVIYAEFRIK